MKNETLREPNYKLWWTKVPRKDKQFLLP
jgi:hypothetical protein